MLAVNDAAVSQNLDGDVTKRWRNACSHALLRDLILPLKLLALPFLEEHEIYNSIIQTYSCGKISNYPAEIALDTAS